MGYNYNLNTQNYYNYNIMIMNFKMNRHKYHDDNKYNNIM